jgi:Peptidase A4 family
MTTLSHSTIQVANGRPFYADSTSDNWSGYNLGYLSTNTKYFEVTGTWIVPTATAHKAGQAEHGATWIGIGGGCLNTSCTETDDTLIQAGTSENVTASGAARYSAWYELVPETSVTEKITVHPGDRVHCFISSTGPGEWTIQLKDTTDGQGFVENTAYSSSELTAEWIVETPVVVSTKGGTGVAHLPDLGVVKFFGSKVNEETPPGWLPLTPSSW